MNVEALRQRGFFELSPSVWVRLRMTASKVSALAIWVQEGMHAYFGASMPLQRAQMLFLRLCQAAASANPEVSERARNALQKAIAEPDVPRERPLIPVLRSDLEEVIGAFEEVEVGGRGRLKRVMRRLKRKVRNLAKKFARNKVIRKVRKAAAKVIRPLGRAGAKIASQALGLLGVPPNLSEQVLRRGGRAAVRAFRRQRRRTTPRLEKLVRKAQQGRVGEVIDEVGEAEDDYFDELYRRAEAYG